MHDDSNSLHGHRNPELFFVQMEWTEQVTCSHWITHKISQSLYEKGNFIIEASSLPSSFRLISIYIVKGEEPLLLGLWACCSIPSNLPCFPDLWRRGPPCFQTDHSGRQDPFKGFPYSGFSLSPSSCQHYAPTCICAPTVWACTQQLAQVSKTQVTITPSSRIWTDGVYEHTETRR